MSLCLTLVANDELYEQNMDKMCTEALINKNSEAIRKAVPQDIVLFIKEVIKKNLFQFDKDLPRCPFKEEVLKVADETSENATLQIIDGLSLKIANTLYEQESNYQNDPEKIIDFLNGVIEKSDSYVKIIIIQLEETKYDLNSEYAQIRQKYENLFTKLRLKDWKQKATSEDLEKIKKLETQIKAVEKILKATKRTKFLMQFTDWVIYSKSPIAWLIRKHIIRVKCHTN